MISFLSFIGTNDKFHFKHVDCVIILAYQTEWVIEWLLFNANSEIFQLHIMARTS
jgi:hypothetical protein